MKIGARIHLYNNNLYSVRKELGMSQVKMAEYIGIPVNYYQAIETLKGSPVRYYDDFYKLIQKIADALNKEINELFPNEYLYAIQQKLFPKKTSFTCIKDIDISRLPLSTKEFLLPSPEDMVEDKALTEAIMSSIDSILTPREATAITLLFGLDGEKPKKVSEVAQIMGISPYRVRTLKDTAIARIRGSREIRLLRNSSIKGRQDDTND